MKTKFILPRFVKPIVSSIIEHQSDHRKHLLWCSRCSLLVLIVCWKCHIN